MPRQPRQRTKANLAYFVNKMIDMFNNTNIRTVVSPNEALLPEVYNDNNTSNDFKWNKTIDYLNTNLNDYANQNDILKFWSNINDELVTRGVDNGEEKDQFLAFKNVHGDFRILCDKIKETGIWTPQIGVVLSAMYKANKVFRREIPAEELSYSSMTNTKRIAWSELNEQDREKIRKIMRPVRMMLEAQNEMNKQLLINYWRFNKYGDMVESFSDKWEFSPDFCREDSRRCFDAINASRDENGNIVTNLLKNNRNKNFQYWLDKAYKNALKYGVEIEMAFPKDKYQEFFNKLDQYRSENFPNGLCYKNAIMPTRDGSIKTVNLDNSSNFSQLEIRTMPMNYEQTKELCQKVCDVASECGAVFGTNVGAGVHIHIDRPNDDSKTIDFINEAYKNFDQWPKIFGRGKIVDDYINASYMNQVKVYKESDDDYAIGGTKISKEAIKNYNLNNNLSDVDEILDEYAMVCGIKKSYKIHKQMSNELAS